MSEWDAGRIEELRQIAQGVGATTKWSPRWINATAAYEEAASPDVVLSLLDELERERKWKALHAASPEGVRDVVSARALAADSLLPIVATWKAKVAELTDELESVRRERDEANEALTIAYMLGSQKAREEAVVQDVIRLRSELADYPDGFGL